MVQVCETDKHGTDFRPVIAGRGLTKLAIVLDLFDLLGMLAVRGSVLKKNYA